MVFLVDGEVDVLAFPLDGTRHDIAGDADTFAQLHFRVAALSSEMVL